MTEKSEEVILQEILRLSDKVDNMEDKMNKLSAKVDNMEDKINNLSDSIDKKFEQFRSRYYARNTSFI